MEITAADLACLPNLPGYSLQPFKDRNHRTQTWAYVNGSRIEQKEGLSHDRPKFVKAVRPADPWRKGTLPDSTTRAYFKSGQLQQHAELPAWDAFDRHVLRFYGYFKEAVVETNLENYRVRRVVFYYYLEDDTCQIVEPRQDNSGIPQGTLIRRHRFPSPRGDYLKPEDLVVGDDVAVYGRVLRLTDCDPFTRDYYAQIGQEQPGPLEIESDPFSRTQEAIRSKEAKPPRNYEKMYREVMLGGGHINADMQQFLENDKKVLRFYAIMDDLSTPQFERRPFLLFFYLADDTVEIREQYPLNCGRDNFPIFFRRNKMMAGPVKLDGPQSQPRKKSEYVHGRDFYVGQHVNLAGNNFFIYDADQFTRQYFDEVLGRPLDERIDVQLAERAVPRPPTPPYTGYGTWDDSMGSVTQLIPKPPKKDFIKLFNNDGKILRFTARFANPKPEDVERLFVINFHLFDDTLSIHEPPQRNLGIVTGKFLDKAVHLNQITGEIFKPADFVNGRFIKVLNHEFEILDCDEYTKKILENPDSTRTRFDLVAVLEKLRDSMKQQFPLARDVFRRFDTDHDGVITQAEFKKGLEKFGFMVSDEEVIILMKHFDSRGDGQVSYNEFCDAVLDEDYTTCMLKTKPELVQAVDPRYKERAAMKMLERSETDAVRKAVREIGDVLYKRVGFMTRLFREIGHMTHLSVVTCEQIQYAFTQLGHSFELTDLQRAVLFIDPNADLEAIPYVQFFRSMNCAYHDMSNIR